MKKILILRIIFYICLLNKSQLNKHRIINFATAYCILLHHVFFSQKVVFKLPLWPLLLRVVSFEDLCIREFLMTVMVIIILSRLLLEVCYFQRVLC